MSWLERSGYGGSLADWLLAGGVAFVLALTFLAARRLLVPRLAAYARTSVTPLCTLHMYSSPVDAAVGNRP